MVVDGFAAHTVRVRLAVGGCGRRFGERKVRHTCATLSYRIPHRVHVSRKICLTTCSVYQISRIMLSIMQLTNIVLLVHNNYMQQSEDVL
jgi:hypothetical protein